MRAALDAALTDAARKDNNICVVVGDVSPIALNTFTKEFPEKFINVGVAEANMIGLAAGLALTGKKPFLFTIATFMTMRCYEQIRDDVCFQNLNIKIIGGGGGFIYSTLGATHHALEDYAIMRVLPNMTVVSPADPFEAKKAILALAVHPGPAYVRLGRNGDSNIYGGESGFGDYTFRIGKSVCMREGKDVALISAGSILRNVMAAADELKKVGISARVINMHTIKPLDVEAIVAAATKIGKLVVIEEHQVTGGLGSAVAEVLADRGLSIPFMRMGVRDVFLHTYGTRDHLLESAGLGTKDIVRTAEHIVTV